MLLLGADDIDPPRQGDWPTRSLTFADGPASSPLRLLERVVTETENYIHLEASVSRHKDAPAWASTARCSVVASDQPSSTRPACLRPRSYPWRMSMTQIRRTLTFIAMLALAAIGPTLRADTALLVDDTYVCGPSGGATPHGTETRVRVCNRPGVCAAGDTGRCCASTSRPIRPEPPSSRPSCASSRAPCAWA